MIYSISSAGLRRTAIVGGGLPLAAGIGFAITIATVTRPASASATAHNEYSFHEILNTPAVGLLILSSARTISTACGISRARHGPEPLPPGACYRWKSRPTDGCPRSMRCQEVYELTRNPTPARRGDHPGSGSLMSDPARIGPGKSKSGADATRLSNSEKGFSRRARLRRKLSRRFRKMWSRRFMRRSSSPRNRRCRSRRRFGRTFMRDKRIFVAKARRSENAKGKYGIRNSEIAPFVPDCKSGQTGTPTFQLSNSQTLSRFRPFAFSR